MAALLPELINTKRKLSSAVFGENNLRAEREQEPFTWSRRDQRAASEPRPRVALTDVPSRPSPYLHPRPDDVHGVGERGRRGSRERPRYGLQEEMGTVLGSQARKLLWEWERERE